VYTRRLSDTQSEVPAQWTLAEDCGGWCDDPVPACTVFYSCPLIEKEGRLHGWAQTGLAIVSRP
jgi:hypothetical protein